MGKTVLALAEETQGIDIVFGADPSVGTSLASCGAEADVVIDFSIAAALPETLDFCVSRKLPLVLATTGHDASGMQAVKAAAEQIPILVSANLSLGALVVSRLVREARNLLAEAYDVTILETHHRAKRDAPSGTAKMLAAAMDMPDATTLSIRGGGVFGTHEVRFLGDMDVITVRHEAIDRRLFAKGALVAARWVAGRAPGLYVLDDVFV